jgi:ribosome maturation factor RimP
MSSVYIVMFRNSPLERAIFFGMKPLREAIIPHVEPVLERAGAYMVDLSIKVEQRSRVVQILVDTDAGITIDACADLSREIGTVLESAGVIDGPYRLEVSSPGLDKPLRLLRQYPKNIGRPFRVRYRSGASTTELRGRLTAVADARLTFAPEGVPAVEIPFEQIIECKEELPW